MSFASKTNILIKDEFCEITNDMKKKKSSETHTKQRRNRKRIPNKHTKEEHLGFFMRGLTDGEQQDDPLMTTQT